MPVSKFYHIPHEAEAIRVSESNMKEVAKWCGGEVISANSALGILSYLGVGKFNNVVNVPTKDGFITVEPGEWLVREKQDGVFFRMNHNEFVQSYQNERKAVMEDFANSIFFNKEKDASTDDLVTE